MSADAKAPMSRSRRIGRHIAVLGFIVFAGYLVITVLTSVTLSLYGKPPSQHPGALSTDDRNYCVRTLVGLRDELEQEIISVAQPPKPRIDARTRWNTWDASFRERFDNARVHCVHDDVGMEHAYESLLAMHDGYANAATRILEVRATFLPAIADVVQLLKDDAK